MSAWLPLASVWTGLSSAVLALAMLLHRPFMTDKGIVAVLYFGAPGAICLAGLVLWSFRKETNDDPSVAAQRLQAKIGIGLAVTAAAIVYALIFFSQKIEPT